MKRLNYILLSFIGVIFLPSLLIAQILYKEDAKVVTYFTDAAKVGLATPDQKARIAVSADGNYGDADDWGATPLTLSIIYHAGFKNRLVHYDFNSKPMSNAWHEKHMELASLEGAKRFGFDMSIFFNSQRDPDGAADNLAKEINISTGNNKLVIFLHGSPGIIWQGVNRSNQEIRKYVYVISHGTFENSNNNDIKRKWGHSAVDVILLGVNWIQISDQDKGKRTAEAGFATGTMDVWEFIKKTRHGHWVYDWIEKVDSDEGVTNWGYRGATGDASDAGIAFYYFTGDQYGNVAKLENFFKIHKYSPSLN